MGWREVIDIGRRLFGIIRDVVGWFRKRAEERRTKAKEKRREIEDEVARQTDDERRRTARRWVRNGSGEGNGGR